MIFSGLFLIGSLCEIIAQIDLVIFERPGFVPKCMCVCVCKRVYVRLWGDLPVSFNIDFGKPCLESSSHG